MTRPTAAELQLRIRKIVDLIATGASRSVVIDHCRAEWGLSPRSADRLLAAARAEMRAEWEDVDRPMFLAQLLSGLSDIQKEAREQGNLGVALAAINSSAKMVGLFR